jgi:hypothetical protein
MSGYLQALLDSEELAVELPVLGRGTPERKQCQSVPPTDCKADVNLLGRPAVASDAE